jgi:hypothetical protein
MVGEPNCLCWFQSRGAIVLSVRSVIRLPWLYLGAAEFEGRAVGTSGTVGRYLWLTVYDQHGRSHIPQSCPMAAISSSPLFSDWVGLEWGWRGALRDHSCDCSCVLTTRSECGPVESICAPPGCGRSHIHSRTSATLMTLFVMFILQLQFGLYGVTICRTTECAWHFVLRLTVSRSKAALPRVEMVRTA